MKAVAIITRTKDRPVMLRRALDSLRGQSFTDFDWVIVNDGGPPEPVDEVVRRAKAAGLNVDALHNPASTGMEAASNKGLRASESKYVVIHDDDDTWEPDFLQQTVTFLEKQPSGGIIRGVVTRTMRVEEVIEKDDIVIKGKAPLEEWLEAVTLFRMANNFWIPPPISFLYRRDVLGEIGYYREDLPVLGDWEFNLRFLRRYDIGVVRDYLANYHWRSVTQGAYSNSIVGGPNLHAITVARVKNELLRKDLDEGRFGMGCLINLVQEVREVERGNVDRSTHLVHEVRHVGHEVRSGNDALAYKLVGEMERVADQANWKLIAIFKERLRKVPLLRFFVKQSSSPS